MLVDHKGEIHGEVTLVYIAVGIVFLHAEQGIVYIVVPEYAHLRTPRVCKAPYEVEYVAVFYLIGLGKHFSLVFPRKGTTKFGNLQI